MENMTGKQEMEKRQKLTEDYLGFSTGSLLGMYAGAKARLWRLSIELEVYCNKMGGRRKSSITITRKEEERVAEKIKESNKDCT
ncbi:MAG: hypothetical protein IMZ64_05510, partial [Bacteroidetes bacterium]|nr:hypothetical protein [Bacteroidota bacterium]